MKERDEDFSSLQTLLRLKRYETPPADSVEDFLSEFHRRQRTELLRRPLWRIALDRVEGFFAVPTLATPRLAYAGACAVALSLAATGMLSRGFSGNDGNPRVAVVKGPPTSIANPAGGAQSTETAGRTVASTPVDFLTPRGFENSSVRFTTTDLENDLRNPAPTARVVTSSQPLQSRYVLETKPVRYEPRSSTF